MKYQLTKEDVMEVGHKLGVLAETEELIECYRLTQEQAESLRQSVPLNGGVWIVPAWAEEAVRGEMGNHVEVLRHISCDARSGGDAGAALRIAKQARKFEKMFTEEAK